MNTYAVDLNFPCDLFGADVNLLRFPKTRHLKINLDKLNPEIVTIFENLGLSIFLVEVFYAQPFFVSGIHVDVEGGDINKVNWVFGGDQSYMNWYEIKDGVIYGGVKQTTIKTPYIPYESNSVTLKFSKKIVSPCLVHVGVPHNICNEKENRWCVSLVYTNKVSGKRPTMAESKILFKDFLL